MQTFSLSFLKLSLSLLKLRKLLLATFSGLNLDGNLRLRAWCCLKISKIFFSDYDAIKNIFYNEFTYQTRFLKQKQIFFIK